MAGKGPDHTGRTFGRLTVLRRTNPIGEKRTKWLCVCVCGEQRIVFGQNLLNGNSTSCGCWNREAASQRASALNRTHGMSTTPEYHVWLAMRRRCYKTNDGSYADYGARGIRVCVSWNESFEAFIADMGWRPSDKHTIERRDNDGDYAPSNCYWATRMEQAVNTRRSLKFGNLKGGRAIAASLGITPHGLSSRIQQGMPDAFTAPRKHR